MLSFPRTCLLLCLCTVMASFAASPAAAAGDPQSGSVSVTIPAGAYEIVKTARGDEIRMEGFGRAGGAGNPMLPGRIFSIAVPPGAVVTSVAFEAPQTIALPGKYKVPPVPLARLVTEQNAPRPVLGQEIYDANYKRAYVDGATFPAAAGELVQESGYRKYDLVDVRIAPFSYNAKTEGLVFRPETVVRVAYEVPAGAAGVADNLARCERIARDIVANYDQAQAWHPAAPEGGGRGLYDFVIITLDSLTAAVQPLVDWETAKGRSVYVATTTWIYSNYSGYDNAERIRNFLRDKYPSAAWGIEDALIVGHYDDVPMRRCYQDVGYGQPETDYYYAELSLPDSSSWDSDGDHRWGENSDPIDFYNEINVGRIPWSDAATVGSICLKSVAFENNSDPTFKKNILLLGAYFWADTDNAVLMEYKSNPSLHPWMSDWTSIRMYEKNSGYYSSYPCDFELLHSNVVFQWSNGRYAFVNWAGHGSPTSAHIYGLGAPAFIDSADCSSLNDSYPAIIFADACSNSDTDYTNIGQSMLKRGGVGFVGATKVALGCPGWNHPNDGSSQSLDYYFTTAVTSGDSTQGEAHQAALRTMYTNGLWGYDRYETFEWGALWGNPDLSMSDSAAAPLAYAFPDGLVEGYKLPGADVTVTVEIRDALENYVPGTGCLCYRYDPGDEFAEAALQPLGGDLFLATLPAPGPDAEPEYYFTAQGDGGSTVTSPINAPASVYSFEVAALWTTFEDNFESDNGWTVVSDSSVTSGAWVRVNPIGTDYYGEVAQPEDDNPAGTGTMCYITQNGVQGGAVGDADLDGGPTDLISPAFDLAGKDAVISYYLWMFNDDGDDTLSVGVSANNGASYTNVQSAGSASWNRFSFRVSDYVTPSSQVKVRFRVSDNPNNSITEAGVDDFAIEIMESVPSLYANGYGFCGETGCDIDIYLEEASLAGRTYLLVGSMSGTTPGTVLPKTGKVLPINRDWFTDYVRAHTNNNVFQNFKGTFDAQGKAVATLHIPGDAAAAYIGVTMHFAFTTPKVYDFASNPIPIEIEP